VSKFFLFDNEFMGCSLAYRLLLEGEEVRVFSKEKEGREHLLGMVEHAKSLEDGLRWVGRDGYVICGDEHDVSPMRQAGFKVYGCNKYLERYETDREFQLKECQKAGLSVPNFHRMESIEEAIKFIKAHPDAWALKQMGDSPKTWNYVGKEDDGSDVIRQLEWFAKQPEFAKVKNKLAMLLQEVVDGQECAVGAFWMYRDWKRNDDGSVLLEFNREHKRSEEHDRGLTCGESGTVMRFHDNPTMFEQTLELLTPLLLEYCTDVCVNIDANCGVVEEHGDVVPYLYEITARAGYPAETLQEHLLNIPVGQFYSELIDGVQGNIEYKQDWGVVCVLGCGHYPAETLGNNHEGSFKDQPVEAEWSENLWPLYVKQNKGEDFYRVADDYEMVAASVASDADILEASKKASDELENVNVRAPHWRSDIGVKFVEKELENLRKWGYVGDMVIA
jgi:phosphoribosylamine---glycine ligase